ncbi:ABC transporter ATP-binding protein [Mangrovactinospora gilvigrisea]|uniref:ABC transporter ATP-binding protein n=1 Tax=Mangrovactinospora gilvigrisea TaxID=1428644 RepID=A0A1J7BJN7_9ACTN|nr:ATP-binding cassette domain-containing protein [Mangrovactinospora gilvigrisea]OIV38899.1 ABC transporter ATP-binding protein [Mangrovactinospora gilvigrisea]
MPEMQLDWNGRTWTLDTDQQYTIGRSPESSFATDDTRVSWRHAVITYPPEQRQWVLKDRQSTNGTYAVNPAIGGPERIHEAPLTSGTALRFGSAADGPVLSVVTAPEPVVAAAGVGGAGAAGGGRGPALAEREGGYSLGGGTVYGDRGATMIRDLTAAQRGRTRYRIGRGLENDLVLTDLMVSRFHAELRPTSDGRTEIVDLDSHNGTYVNGVRVERHVLAPTDVVGIGHSAFRLVGTELQEFEDTGAVSFAARELVVEVGPQKTRILDRVSFGLGEKSLVAVVGPSGAGKSTLIKALTGYRPADSGDVLYDGRNLYKEFAELRSRIGLVPQDDILHSQLTVRTALRYAARLRFPGDTRPEERNARVEEVIRELGLDQRADNRITTLSGGQRKRVSVALELLTKPSLLLLDEPTSGLDPGREKQTMQTLRGLADDGRTVMVVTHAVASLNLCDRVLVLAVGGKVAYFGPPEEALAFFRQDDWADVLIQLEEHKDYDWAQRYRDSQHYQVYSADVEAVAPENRQGGVGVAGGGRGARAATAPPKPQGWLSQLTTLCRRYVSVISSDRGFIVLMAVLPLVLGAVSRVIPSADGLAAPPGGGFNKDAPTVLLMLAIAACFTGAANSVRELVKERVIYERERATGLSRSAYVLSKVIVLGVITAVQGIVIAGIGMAGRKLPTEGLVLKSLPEVELILVIMLLGVVAMMVGLVISSVVRAPESTQPLLVIFAIVQVVFTGALFKIPGTPGLEQVAWLMPSRWGVAAHAATINLNKILPPWDPKHPNATDPLWDHTASQWGINMGALALLAIVAGVLVTRLLRRHEPEVMRKR